MHKQIKEYMERKTDEHKNYFKASGKVPLNELYKSRKAKLNHVIKNQKLGDEELTKDFVESKYLEITHKFKKHKMPQFLKQIIKEGKKGKHLIFLARDARIFHEAIKLALKSKKMQKALNVKPENLKLTTVQVSTNAIPHPHTARYRKQEHEQTIEHAIEQSQKEFDKKTLPEMIASVELNGPSMKVNGLKLPIKTGLILKHLEEEGALKDDKMLIIDTGFRGTIQSFLIHLLKHTHPEKTVEAKLYAYLPMDESQYTVEQWAKYHIVGDLETVATPHRPSAGYKRIASSKSRTIKYYAKPYYMRPAEIRLEDVVPSGSRIIEAPNEQEQIRFRKIKHYTTLYALVDTLLTHVLGKEEAKKEIKKL